MCRNKAGSTEYGVFRQILSVSDKTAEAILHFCVSKGNLGASWVWSSFTAFAEVPLCCWRPWSCVSSCNARTCMNTWRSWVRRFWTDSTTTQRHAWLCTGACLWLVLFCYIESVEWIFFPVFFMCFDILQGTPLSSKELCDAHAVPGSASPPGSCGIVGKERQSEVSCLCCSVCPLCCQSSTRLLCWFSWK